MATAHVISPLSCHHHLRKAVVANPFPCRTLEVVDQATVRDEYSDVVTPSDDPNTPPIGDATATPVDAAPLMSVHSRVLR